MARLSGTYLKNSGNTTLDSASYGYNQAGQRTSFTNAAGTYVNYSYDNIGQLKVADSSVNTEDRGYLYDAAWNLNDRTNNGLLSTFTVDPKNQLTNASPIGPQTYDANGNPTYSSGNNVGYSYDDENRLVNWYYYDGGYNGNGAPTSAADLRTEFVYDGRGRLRQRVEYTASSGSPYSWIVSSETRYVYDGRRVIQERNSANTPTVSYTRGTDLSSTLEGAGGIGGLLARSDSYSGGNPTRHVFYHADGNGNITYLVDSSQALAASYRYDSFGNTTASSGTLAGANVYRFSSKEIHVNSGMYYYGYRFYDPNLQRWPNRDPIQEAGGINLYTFVGNDPLDYSDAFGQNAGTIVGGALGSFCGPEGTAIGAWVGTAIGIGVTAILLTGDSPPKKPDQCNFYKTWCEWGNNRPAGDKGKGWKRNAPCNDCYKSCKSNGTWPFDKCPIPGNGDPKGRGPAWPPGGKFPGGGGPVWPPPGQY